MLEATPPNYSFLTEGRKERKGGRTGHSLKKTPLNFKKISLGTFHSFEYLATEMKEPNKVLDINMYKPPKASSNFINDLNDLISVICIDYDQLIVAGNFNIHTENL